MAGVHRRPWWWEVLALLFRNPFAIGVNFWALFRPPPTPDYYGAITLTHLAEAAELDEQPQQEPAVGSAPFA